MVDNKYYCLNCKAELKPTDTVCPNCGKNLSEVGRGVLVTVADTITLSDTVSVTLTPEERTLLEKVYQKIKDFLVSKEIESVTINLGVISVKIRNKDITKN